MKILTADMKWERGDIATERGRFNTILAYSSNPTIADRYSGSLRPENIEEVKDYAIKHPEVFKDMYFKQVYPQITLESLSENERYFMELHKARVK
jgi:hypothetical protein